MINNNDDINDNNNITIRNLLTNNLPQSIRIVILMMLVTGIGYPVLLSFIGTITLPFQSQGSLIIWNGQVIGSELLAQEFTSPQFFHSRPATDSASTVDPHITPESAYQQISNVSKATGIPENVLKTIIDLDIERNKVSNLIVFAPNFVNVLAVNLELVNQYPEIYSKSTVLELVKNIGIT
jgi:potassium-transporting ATPase KdpC subunit